MKKSRYGGFTLIEMICVIAIIGILTTIAVPQFSKYIDRANETKITSAVLELNNTLVLLKTDNIKDNLDIQSIISENGKNSLGLKIEGAAFKVGKYEGQFVLEDEKVVAKLSKPNSEVFTINGKISNN